MYKLKIVMISNENCIHCINARKVLERFVANNKSLVELKVVYQAEYRRSNVYGDYDEFPVFIFIGKSGNYKRFDFINDEKTERSYDKLKTVINEIHRLM